MSDSSDAVPGMDDYPTPYPANSPHREIVFADQSSFAPIIVVEGPDGAGKSTQILLLENRLKGAGYEPIVFGFVKSDLTRDLLLRCKWENLDPYTHSLVAITALTDLVNRRVLPALREGKIVIMDRYTPTIYARGGARGCSLDWLTGALSHLQLPSFNIYIHTPIDTCLERKLSDVRPLSYWESGADLADDDSIRWERNSTQFKASFFSFQSEVDRLSLMWLKGEAYSVVIDGGQSALYMETEIWSWISGLLESSFPDHL